jgi:hypothetical protein
MGLQSPTDTITPAVNITIADDAGSTAVVNGQLIRYQIKVMNSAETESAVTVRLSLPAGALSEISADQAAIVADAAAWRLTLGAGETRTYAISATVSTSKPDLSATACVHSSKAVLACATDLDRVDNQDPVRGYAWIASILLGFLAVALSLWLQRAIQPEFLTPANAAITYGNRTENPGQPGGAPSA